MSIESNRQTSTFTQEFAKLTEQLYKLLDNLKKRGYLIPISESRFDTRYHVKDRAGHYLGSATELSVKPGLNANAVESHTYLNRQVLVKKLSELSERLKTDGGDHININTMKLEGRGFKTSITHLENSIRVKVADANSKEVREFVVSKKETLNGTENKAIANWLSAQATDSAKLRATSNPKEAINS